MILLYTALAVTVGLLAATGVVHIVYRWVSRGSGAVGDPAVSGSALSSPVWMGEPERRQNVRVLEPTDWGIRWHD